MSRTLTVVMPVYNEARWLPRTLADLAQAVRGAPSLVVDVVVVDDGSTDASAETAADAAGDLDVRVLKQRNAGRQAARAGGLAAAGGELVLFLDSRVSILPGSLEFIAGRLDADADDTVWNAHVVIETEGNPYGRFWNVLTELVFSEYFANPRTTSFDAETFEAFPKGTTCFLAPRALLVEAFGGHASIYEDPRHANDDTPMIRRIASAHPVGISPLFACIYRPRDRAVPFLRHAFHRGIVFLDGHGRRGARLRPAVVAFYPVSAALALSTVRRPWVAPASLLAVAAGAATVAAAKHRTRDEVVAFAGLAPLYAVAHGLGMWRGLALALSSRLRRA